MGLSRLQGTSGYIGYFGSNEGKRTRFNCDHYDRVAMCCCRDKKIQECKSPGRCHHHTDYPQVYLNKEVEKRAKIEGLKKKATKSKSKKENGIIKTGSNVNLLNLVTNTKIKVTVVDPRDANRAENKFSRTGLLGKFLMGEKAGKVIQYRFDGKIERYKIVNVES